MRIGLVVMFCLAFNLVVAQVYNYVPNAQFEVYDTCPDDDGQLNRLKHWFNPTLNSPDFFHSCANNVIYQGQFVCGAPYNFYGFQVPHSGNGYAGFGTASIGNGRDYLGVKLKQELNADSTYCIKAWIARAEISKKAMGSFGFFFSKTRINLTNEYTGTDDEIDSIPQYFHPINNFVIDTAVWTLIEGSFVAEGGELYVTIGNFFKNDITQYIVVDTSALSDNYVFYYIDDVSVTKCSQVTSVNALVETTSIQVYPNPASTEITVKSLHQITQLQIVDAVGRIIKTFDTNFHQAVIDVSNFSNGIYFLKQVDATTGVATQTKFVVMR